jgi:hypothetical protein
LIAVLPGCFGFSGFLAVPFDILCHGYVLLFPCPAGRTVGCSFGERSLDESGR